MASIVSINLSEKKGTVKQPALSGRLLPDFGFEGDAHAGNWHRQVSLLAQESIDRMTAMGVPGLTPAACTGCIASESI
jgi:hypothetical protein